MPKPAEAQELGRRIAEFRRKARLTQGAAAAAVGVHRLSWSRWERGEQVPDALLLGAIAGVLGVSADQLLGMPPVSQAEAARVGASPHRP